MGRAGRGKDYDTQVLLWGAGRRSAGHVVPADPNSQDQRRRLGLPRFVETTIPLRRTEDLLEVREQARAGAVRLTAKETDPEKRTKYFQEIDCILNQEIPYLHDGGSVVHPEQEQAAAGCGLGNRRQPGLVDGAVPARRLLALAAVARSTAR